MDAYPGRKHGLDCSARETVAVHGDGCAVQERRVSGFTALPTDIQEYDSAADDHRRKNRRDGATVSARVLSLTDKIGRELFASAGTTVDVSHRDQSLPSSSRRRKEIQTKARL